MRNDKRLPDAELEVMQTIWALGAAGDGGGGTAARRQGLEDHERAHVPVPAVRQGISFLHEGGTAKPVHAARQREGLPSA